MFDLQPISVIALIVVAYRLIRVFVCLWVSAAALTDPSVELTDEEVIFLESQW